MTSVAFWLFFLVSNVLAQLLASSASYVAFVITSSIGGGGAGGDNSWEVRASMPQNRGHLLGLGGQVIISVLYEKWSSRGGGGKVLFSYCMYLLGMSSTCPLYRSGCPFLEFPFRGGLMQGSW